MTLSAKQQEFLNAVQEGKNIYLTGKAGTGKSYVVKQAIEWLAANRKKVVALAPTGIAADNIGGQTIHSFFSLNPFGVMDYKSTNFLKTGKRQMMDKIDTIFIDEISMLRPDILDGMNWTLTKNGCKTLKTKQIIFVGDLKQLPSVLDDNTKSVLLRDYDTKYFYSAKCYKDLNVVEIELDEILRQSDEEFIEALNLIREGKKSSYFKKFITEEHKGIVLAPYNSTVAKYNEAGLKSVDAKEYVFEASVNDYKKNDKTIKPEDFGLESYLKVKHGAKIMYLVNSKNNPLVNGTIGEFVVKEDDKEGKKFWIKVGGVEYFLEKVTKTKKEYIYDDYKDELVLEVIADIEQYPIKLAYALSIHKSQGLTFDEVTVDLVRNCFSEGQLYVALSRVTGPDGLRIIM
jgi:ATP-dependent exoDNAse (exonuclease V) alpha subunit